MSCSATCIYDTYDRVSHIRYETGGGPTINSYKWSTILSGEFRKLSTASLLLGITCVITFSRASLYYPAWQAPLLAEIAADLILDLKGAMGAVVLSAL